MLTSSSDCSSWLTDETSKGMLRGRVGNKRVSVFKDEAEVFKLLQAKEVVVEVRMGIGNKASFCIVGNIADVEGMVVEGTSLDIGILGIGGWYFDIVEVERNRCA
ncbi:hypothetical protein TNCV_1039631 [Trichonephila clavipes]|nr:hypothetical protein TNCV_1039631 [Trichonephila clavipes]